MFLVFRLSNKINLFFIIYFNYKFIFRIFLQLKQIRITEAPHGEEIQVVARRRKSSSSPHHRYLRASLPFLTDVDHALSERRPHPSRSRHAHASRRLVTSSYDPLRCSLPHSSLASTLLHSCAVFPPPPPTRCTRRASVHRPR